MAKTRRQRYEDLRVQLENERSSFVSHWRDIADYICPRRQRFTLSDTNKGSKVNGNILDSTATKALRTLSSGMMAGITSPARPWFRLTTPDPILAESQRAREWLDVVARRMQTVFLRSNLYNVLPTTYTDLGAFATAAIWVEENFDHVIHFHSQPIGSYSIGCDRLGRANIFFREIRMTVRQVIDEFAREGDEIDWNVVSTHIRNLYENGNTEAWVDVCHVVMPNPDYDEQKSGSKYKKYLSVYYEKGFSGVQNGYYLDPNWDMMLRESGYDYFPVLVPRWKTTGEDWWGTDSPGMICLGDVKMLQKMERRALQALDKMVNPPLSGPSTLRGQTVSLLPGNVTFHDLRSGQEGLRPIHEVRPDLQNIEAKMSQVRDRIRQVLYEDLFLMMIMSDRRQITATEIEERHEEKLLALGPVLEQLNQHLLDPLIDITFVFMDRQGLIPDPPEELMGVDLRVEYISIMAQAQKLVGISGIERFTQYAGMALNVSQDQSINDKVVWWELLNEYADAVGINAKGIRSNDDAEARIAMKEQQARQAQMAQSIPPIAKAAKDLSETDMEKDSALARLLSQAQAGSPVATA